MYHKGLEGERAERFRIGEERALKPPGFGLASGPPVLDISVRLRHIFRCETRVVMEDTSWGGWRTKRG
jgi:hypothetical protein